jgi:GAF domain-containing protein
MTSPKVDDLSNLDPKVQESTPVQLLALLTIISGSIYILGFIYQGILLLTTHKNNALAAQITICVTFLLSAFICFFSLRIKEENKVVVKAINLIFAAQLIGVVNSLLIKSLGFYIAITGIGYSLLIALPYLNKKTMKWLIPLMVLGAMLCSIMSAYSPVNQINNKIWTYGTVGLFILVVITFIILLITRKMKLGLTEKSILFCFSLVIGLVTLQIIFLKYLNPYLPLTSGQKIDLNRFTIILDTILLGLGFYTSYFVSTLLIRPLYALIATAESIASGNFEVQSRATTADEIGFLSNILNRIGQAFKQSIKQTENTAKEQVISLSKQNQTLQERNAKLQTVSLVAKEIISTQELEDFLTRVTGLLSQRFGFYHIGIFLIDDSGQYALLRAANSEGGKRMLERKHQLGVGQVGIVGFVTGTGTPRVTSNVGEDSVFFDNPDLPETRSEMALPLRAGDKIIGALDIQSSQSDAFTSEDVEIFTILADQIAIAITNNRLYEQTLNTLVETQRLYREYLYQEWTRETGERKIGGYRYTPSGVLKEPIGEPSPEISKAILTGQIIIQSEPDNPIAMAVPIILRGETIGVIRLQDISGEREWSNDEIAAVQAVADQVALALENARLFEQTLRRADRERKVLEITSKIRATNDPQVMLQTALEELQKALNISRAQIILLNPRSPQGNLAGGTNEPDSHG